MRCGQCGWNVPGGYGPGARELSPGIPNPDWDWIQQHPNSLK